MAQQFSVYRKIESSPGVAVRGQVFTKPHIVELMLDLAQYSGEKTIRVLDPGCGEGAFCVAAASRLIRTNGLPTSFEDVADAICAVDTDISVLDTCRQRMISMLVREGMTKHLAKKLAAHWIIECDFLDARFERQFDLVIGNPPYVRQEAIPKDKLEQYRSTFECFYDRADLYVAFFEKSLKLLRADGRLAFICPDRFAKNKYGTKLRELISRYYCVECVLDLAQASPFEPEVSCYPGVFVLRNSKVKTQPVDFFRLTHATPTECDYVRKLKSNGAVTHHRYETWFTGSQQWSVESPEHLALLRRLETDYVAMGDTSSGCRVGIGVASGADKIFIGRKDQLDIEPELLMPLVTTGDIDCGELRWSGQYIINPFVGDTTELIDFSKFPKAKAYFNAHREHLQRRNVAKRDQNRWYRTIDRIYPWLQTTPKLLIPDIKAENLIVLEPGTLYPHHNLYYVASETWNLTALRTVLRSTIAKFFVWMYGVKMRGDFLRFQAQYLRRICIPNLKDIDESSLSQLLAAEESNDQERIDEVVGTLYRLTSTELALVKSTASPRTR